jgi:hypothetical protein
VRIGIIGAGSLGAALGARLAGAGHAIMFGGADAAAQAARRLGLRAGSNEEAAAFGDLLALAVPSASIDAALAQTGPLEGGAPGARAVAAVPPFAEALPSGAVAYERELLRASSSAATTRARSSSSSSSCATLARSPSNAGPAHGGAAGRARDDVARQHRLRRGTRDVVYWSGLDEAPRSSGAATDLRAPGSRGIRRGAERR